MRIKELADLAGTTVRTVRYYHHQGLLRVPPTLGGIRDYGLDHLARLVRIRWLARSGLSLATIAETLAESEATDAGATLDSLTTTLAEIDERIADLARQREHVAALIDRVRDGAGVSPISPTLSRMYERLLERMPTPQARRAVESERKVAAILALWGMLPAALERFLAELTEADEDTVVEMFVGFAELAQCPPSHYGEQCERVRRLVLDVLDQHESATVAMLEALPRGIAGKTAWALFMRLSTLGYPAPGHRRFIAEIGQIVDSRPAFAAALGRGQTIEVGA
ncbi:MAG: MerR family transcriptional regulator [Nocardiaceae bacterium]|nr:MerR family transcriptional regulator [Nocardiaceae bacterium]